PRPARRQRYRAALSRCAVPDGRTGQAAGASHDRFRQAATLRRERDLRVAGPESIRKDFGRLAYVWRLPPLDRQIAKCCLRLNEKPPDEERDHDRKRIFISRRRHLSWPRFR